MLREAGYRAGAEVLTALGEEPSELTSNEFWTRLDAALERAGLGSVRFEAIASDAGAVAWRESAEATSSEDHQTHCHFALGLLGGVLSRAADRTVDVVEVQCGGGAREPCWFVFGSVETLRGVRARLANSRAPLRRVTAEAERP